MTCTQMNAIRWMQLLLALLSVALLGWNGFTLAATVQSPTAYEEHKDGMYAISQ